MLTLDASKIYQSGFFGYYSITQLLFLPNLIIFSVSLHLVLNPVFVFYNQIYILKCLLGISICKCFQSLTKFIISSPQGLSFRVPYFWNREYKSSKLGGQPWLPIFLPQNSAHWSTTVLFLSYLRAALMASLQKTRRKGLCFLGS